MVRAGRLASQASSPLPPEQASRHTARVHGSTRTRGSGGVEDRSRKQMRGYRGCVCVWGERWREGAGGVEDKRRKEDATEKVKK